MKRGRETVDLQVDFVADNLRIGEVDVLDVNDPVKPPHFVHELGDLVEMPRKLETHRHFGEERLRLLVLGLPALEVDAADVRYLLERREERRSLRVGR